MKLDASKRNTIIQFLSTVPESRLQELVDLQREITFTNSHCGMNSQVKANNEFLEAFDKVLDDMNDYYIKELNSL